MNVLPLLCAPTLGKTPKESYSLDFPGAGELACRVMDCKTSKLRTAQLRKRHRVYLHKAVLQLSLRLEPFVASFNKCTALTQLLIRGLILSLFLSSRANYAAPEM